MRALLSLLLIVLFVCNGVSLAQDEYPDAIPTDSPDVVVSPFNKDRRLDVAGLEAGSLAEDPVEGKIFRIPFSNPTKRYYDDFGDQAPQVDEDDSAPVTTGSSQKVVPPPPVKNSSPAKKEQRVPQPDGPNTPSWIPASNKVPKDLRNFIYAFNQNSSVNDASTLLPFYSNPVQNYFGKSNFSHQSIKADRESYIRSWPRREYFLEGTPVLLSQKGNVFEVLTRVRYNVSNDSRTHSAGVSHNYKIRRTDKYEILSITEARASAAPADIRKQDVENTSSSLSGSSTSGQSTVYNRFEVDQISLFLDAFAAAGEVNLARCQLDFLHPEIKSFFGLQNPNTEALLKSRRDFITQWPTRRYWLTEKPILEPLGGGSWKVVAKTGWQVKKGSKVVDGVSSNHMRIVYTSAGLKISAIHSK